MEERGELTPHERQLYRQLTLAEGDRDQLRRERDLWKELAEALLGRFQLCRFPLPVGESARRVAAAKKALGLGG